MRSIALAITMAFALLLAPWTPAFGATKTPVTFTDCIVSQDAPERVWISGNKILHVRGQTLRTEVFGNLTGTFTLDFNLNQNIETGKGTHFGSFVQVSPLDTWEGHFRGKVDANGISGSLVGQGETTKIMGTFVQISPACFENEAIILDPHG
jgi:hypothetical protein